MASRRSTLRGTQRSSKELGEELDALTKRLDRAKVLYEQYFMGIQKTPPAQLHRDIERQIRELTQHQIRNTALRFRFATLSQKFGSYNTYWKRTLRRIEQGTYLRDIRRVKRRAEARGEDIPPEILAAMPKRMRDRVERDRKALAKRADRQQRADGDDGADRPDPPGPGNVHHIDEDEVFADGNFDLDAVFDKLMGDEAGAPPVKPEPAKTPPAGATVTPPTPPPIPPPTPGDAPQRAPTGTAPGTGTARSPSPPARGTNRPRGARPDHVPGLRASTIAGTPPPRPPSPAIKRQPPARPKPAPARPKPAPAAARRPPGMSRDDGEKLYRRYVQARKLVGERVDNLSYDKLMKTLSKQAPQIMRQHNAAGVDFSVVVKGKKVVVKAKPKKK